MGRVAHSLVTPLGMKAEAGKVHVIRCGGRVKNAQTTQDASVKTRIDY